MVRPERDGIGGEYPVEVDECFIGGVHNKTIVVGALEVRLRKDAELRSAKYKQEHSGGVPLKKLVYAGRLRLRVVTSRSAANLVSFVLHNVARGSTIRTDAAPSYEELPGYGYIHEQLRGKK
jgi:hypothetical protein